MTYSYNTDLIFENGKDKMRFELGDTLVEGGESTCVLSDEEYIAVIENNGNTKSKYWERMKLQLLEAICMKLSFQVDTKVDIVSYSFSDRAKLWKEMYLDLKRRLSVSVPSIDCSMLGENYFYTGMQGNARVR